MRAMWAGRATLAALLMLCFTVTCEAKDNWLGCWTRSYDADHLAKHQAQDVTAIGVSIVPGEPKAGTKDDYRASVKIKLRDKPETYANVAAVHCRKAGARLHCLAKDKSRENFWLRRSGPDLQLQLTAAGEGVEVVPPNKPTGFVQILPQNPEYQLFVMQRAPLGSCSL
jgi:hypothetical protein